MHLDPGVQCGGCWPYIVNLSSLGPKALHLWQPGKASVSMGSRYVRWSLPLLGRKIIYSRFPYTHFLRNSSVEFYDNLSGRQQGLTASGQLWSSHVSLSPWEPQKKKRFHVVAPNTETSLTGIATSEISWPACRNRPMPWCKWLPNAHFLHTKLEKYQQNQQEGDSEGKKGWAVRTRDFSTPFWFLYLSQILRMLSPLLSIHYLPQSLHISGVDLKPVTFFQPSKSTKDVVRYKMFN